MTSFKTSLRNTRWATQYLSDVWLSTNGVLHVHWEIYNLQAGANTNSPMTGAKRPGGETSRGRNVQVAKRPGGETSCEGAKPNVHKPHAHQHSIETAKHIIKLISPSGGHISFFVPNGMATLRRESPYGGVECRAYEKRSRFRPISRFISELIKDTAILTMDCEEETVPKLFDGAIFNDL